jgi:hypothetical protein
VRYDDNALSAPERAALERAKDLLVRLAGERAMERLDPSDATEAMFLEWYAREARTTLSVAEPTGSSGPSGLVEHWSALASVRSRRSRRVRRPGKKARSPR